MIDPNTDMRFMSNNFLETGYNTLAVSSVGAGTYQEDLTTYERSRVMRFGGRFTIMLNTNDFLYMNGNTIQIPPGEYTGPSLASYISGLSGPSHLTCTYNATTFNFIFAATANTTLDVSNTVHSMWETIGIIGGGANISILSGANHFSEMPRIHWPNEKIVMDFGYQAPIGFVAMIGDLTKELRIPQGATLQFQANNVNDFTAPPVNKTFTWTTKGVFLFIDDLIDSAWRYCQIIITCPTGPFMPEIGYLYVGDYSVFIDRNVSVGVDIGYIDASLISLSDDGQEFVNEKTPFRNFRALSVGLASPANVTYMNRLFALKQKTKPFFVALDPHLRISESIGDMTAFCKFSIEPSNKHQFYNKYNLSFELKEAL